MQKKSFIKTLFSFQSVLNRGRRVRCQPVAKTVRKENHDGRIQRRAVVKTLQPICSFEAENFKVRKDRRLGSGSFGDVYACSFGCMGKIQCVIKIAKEGGEEDLLLECRILKKLLEEPSDLRQKFFAHAYGYNRNEKGLVLDRFFGLSVRQHAQKQVQNDWVQRLLEISEALVFMHSRNVLHLDLHSSNVLASNELAKIIDFGKATLTNYPVTFNLDPEERSEYNDRYKQVEYELRNQKGAKTSFCSDVYSLGVLIKYIAEKCLLSNSLRSSLLQLSESCCAQRATRSSMTLLLLDLNELVD